MNYIECFQGLYTEAFKLAAGVEETKLKDAEKKLKEQKVK